MTTDFYFEVLNVEDLSFCDRLVLRWLDWRTRRRYPALYGGSYYVPDGKGLFEIQDEWEALFHEWILRKMTRRTKAIIGVCSTLLLQPVIFEKGRERFWLDEAVRHASGEWGT